MKKERGWTPGPDSQELHQEAMDEAFKDACRLVENVARSLGKNCEVIFLDDCVSVAPPSWAGDSTGKTLYDALTDARKHEEG